MEKKKILIIEDEALIAEDTKSMLNDLGYEVIGIAKNLTEASGIIESMAFDIALVDLMLGSKKDGVEVARILKNKRKPFIITSSFSDKETLDEIKSLTPAGYIVKPIQENDLYAAIEIIPVDKENEYIKHLDGSVFYKDKDLFIRIIFSEIEYLKADGNYVEVYSNNKKHLLRITFEEFLQSLPDNFVRTHRSYAINCKLIKAVNSAYVEVGTYKVPLSRSHRDEFLKKITVL